MMGTSSGPWSVVGALGFGKILDASYDAFELLIAEDWAWAGRCTRAPPQLQRLNPLLQFLKLFVDK